MSSPHVWFFKSPSDWWQQAISSVALGKAVEIRSGGEVVAIAQVGIDVAATGPDHSVQSFINSQGHYCLMVVDEPERTQQEDD